MVAEHVDDGEGEMLRRVRAVVGPGLPIAVSLDLHANVTPEMVEHADVLDLYRTYPQVEMAANGRTSALQLAALLESGTRLPQAYPQLTLMIPRSRKSRGGEEG